MAYYRKRRNYRSYGRRRYGRRRYGTKPLRRYYVSRGGVRL